MKTTKYNKYSDIEIIISAHPNGGPRYQVLHDLQSNQINDFIRKEMTSWG